jgi:hypothetical protein
MPGERRQRPVKKIGEAAMQPAVRSDQVLVFGLVCAILPATLTVGSSQICRVFS